MINTRQTVVYKYTALTIWELRSGLHHAIPRTVKNICMSTFKTIDCFDHSNQIPHFLILTGPARDPPESPDFNRLPDLVARRRRAFIETETSSGWRYRYSTLERLHIGHACPSPPKPCRFRSAKSASRPSPEASRWKPAAPSRCPGGTPPFRHRLRSPPERSRCSRPFRNPHSYKQRKHRPTHNPGHILPWSRPLSRFPVRFRC